MLFTKQNPGAGSGHLGKSLLNCLLLFGGNVVSVQAIYVDLTGNKCMGNFGLSCHPFI